MLRYRCLNSSFCVEFELVLTSLVVPRLWYGLQTNVLCVHVATCRRCCVHNQAARHNRDADEKHSASPDLSMASEGLIERSLQVSGPPVPSDSEHSTCRGNMPTLLGA